MPNLRNAASVVLAGSLAAIAASPISAAAPPVTHAMTPLSAAPERPPRSGASCDLILQGKPVASFAKISASIASAAGPRAQGSLVLKGDASRGDPALQKWVEGSQRGEHQEVKVACSRGGRAAETYALHNAWASRMAYTPGAQGRTSVRLTIRYERLTVKMENSCSAPRRNAEAARSAGDCAFAAKSLRITRDTAPRAG
jgi:hypothetical protein